MMEQKDWVSTHIETMTQQESWDCLLSALRGSLPDIPESDEEAWARICRLAQQLGTAPLLHQRLTLHGLIGSIPAPSREYLQTSYMHTAMHNTRLYHFLKQALIALSDAGVPVTLLKGSYLAKGVYQNIAMRPMGDADILVPLDKLWLAAEVIQGLGYTPDRPITPGRLGCHHLPSFTREAGMSLELHSSSRFMDLTEPISESEFARLMERTRPWMMDGCKVSILSPEDQMLHLCLHPSTAHGFVVDLRPFFDIAQSIECGGEIDWQALLARARSWGYLRSVCFTLSLAERWAGAVVPREVSDLFTPDMADPDLIRRVQAKVLNAPQEDFIIEFYERDGSRKCTTKCLSVNIRPFFSRKGYGFNLGYFLKSVFPPVDVMRNGRAKLLSAHPARLIRLSARGCSLLWRCLRGRVVMRTTTGPDRRLHRITRRHKRVL